MLTEKECLDKLVQCLCSQKTNTAEPDLNKTNTTDKNINSGKTSNTFEPVPLLPYEPNHRKEQTE